MWSSVPKDGDGEAVSAVDGEGREEGRRAVLMLEEAGFAQVAGEETRRRIREQVVKRVSPVGEGREASGWGRRYRSQRQCARWRTIST